MGDSSATAGRSRQEYEHAGSEVVQWDEFGQGYNARSELVVCICGEPYPLRKEHYCPADERDQAESGRAYRVGVTLELDAPSGAEALAVVRDEMRGLESAGRDSVVITHAWLSRRAIAWCNAGERPSAACPHCQGGAA